MQLSSTSSIRPAAQRRDEVLRRQPGTDLEADSRGDRAAHLARVCDPRQVDDPDAVLVGTDHPLGHGERHGRLADPARPDDREQAVRRQLFGELGDDLAASDQRRQLLGQVVAPRGADRRRRPLPLLAGGHGRDEAVSLPLARLDEPPAVLPIAEHPPEGGHLELEVAFHDVGVGPDPGEQLGLADPLAGPFEQGEEDVEGAASDADGPARFQQKPLAGQDLEPVEREGGFDRGRMLLGHCSLTRCVCHHGGANISLMGPLASPNNSRPS